MKTLDQISSQIVTASPGVVLNATTTPGDAGCVFRITQPGAYRLSANLSAAAGKDGIVIDASNVTLDLAGFSLIGVTGSGNGISLAKGNIGIANVVIGNGIISGFGGRGIYTASAAAVQGLVIEDLTITCTGQAIRTEVFGSTIVRRVHVRSGTGGILCVGPTSMDLIEDCQVTSCAGEAIHADVVERCMVSQSTLVGFVVISGSRVSNCLVSAISSVGPMVGILADEVGGCVVTDLTTSGAVPIDGIQADSISGSRVANLSSAGGNVRGLAQKSPTENGVVTASSVSGLQTSGSGTVIGIFSGTVDACQATKIGFVSSTGSVTGIFGTSLVKGCGARDIGHSGTTGTVTGTMAGTLSASFPDGQVQGTNVRSVNGGGIIYGIGAGTVVDSSVNTITQQASAGFVIVRGIIGGKVTASSATGIQANCSLSGSGIYADDVLNCRVANVSNAGAGDQDGIQGNSVKGCTVSGSDGIGITTSNPLGHVSGCSVSSCIRIGIKSFTGGIVAGNFVTTSGTGLETDSAAKVLVTGNHVTSCSTKYNLGAATRFGPIINSAGTISNTNPFCNFSD